MRTTSLFGSAYDAVMNFVDRVGLMKRRASLGSGARGRVLEIGSGTGLEFLHYPAGAQVIAVERYRGMVLRAMRRRSEAKASVSLVLADARALPFRAGVFDTVVSAMAFCSIPEPERAAAEITRVLSTSGSVRLLEHVRASHQPLAFIQALLTPLWRRVAGGCHLDQRTIDVIRQAGLAVNVAHSAFDGALVELVAGHADSVQGDERGGSVQGSLSPHSSSVAIM